MKNRKPICGVGINDADYAIHKYATVNGKYKLIWKCPYYVVWVRMLHRCYSEKWLTKYPTYRGCTVSDEWLVFSNFKQWMETQNWEGKHLDKDLLIQGNKIYSADTSVFVEQRINSFTTDSAKTRGKCLIGVSWFKPLSKFQARCRNPFTGKQEHLGFYDDELDAHLVWRKRKHELACELAELCNDRRLAEALKTRYSS